MIDPAQRTLFDPPRARRDDKPTSKVAARRVSEFADDHFARIVAALLEHGPGTCWDIAGWTGLDHVAVARRMNELVAIRKVHDTKATRPSPTGRPCAVWAAT